MILIRPLIRANIARRHNIHVFDLFHHSGRQCRRRVEPAGRSAAVHRLSQRRRFLLDHAASLDPDRASLPGLLLAMFCAFDLWRLPQPNRSTGHVGPRSPIRVRGLVNIAADRGHHRCILLSANWRPGIAVDIFGTRLELQNLVRDGLLVADRTALVMVDAGRASRGEWVHLGADQGGRKTVRRAYSSSSFPCWPRSMPGRRGFFAWLLSAVTERDGTPHEVAYFWYTGADVGVPRQRADLSVVLQARRRRRAGD